VRGKKLSKSNPVAVSAATIRKAFAAGEFSVPDGTNLASVTAPIRGRLNPAIAAAYVAANKGTIYSEKSVAEKRMVTLPLVKRSAKGASLKRPEAFPVSEVRTLAGAPSKGRLSREHLATAARKVEAQRGW
jgi:hypothetical protein